MPVTYELETPTGAKYDVEFDSEPTEEMMNAALRDITASESDTGQGVLSSMAGAAARGAAGLAPAVAQGVGALIPGESGRDVRALGKLLQEDVEEALPVNPAYQDTMPVKGAAAVGQGLAFLGGALASGGSSLPVLGVGGLAGAAGGADVADQYGLEGWRRGVATVGAGAAEVVSERLFGLGSPRFLKGAGRPLIEGAKAVAGEAVEEPIAGALGDLSTNAALLGTDNPLLNPLDPAKRGEEALYGAIGAGPFGGIAALNARHLRGSKLFATVDGQVTPLPDDITEKEVEKMGLRPQDVAVVPQGKAQEMMDAILRARTEGEKTNVASVLTEASRTPSVFDAPPPTAEEIAALDETPEPEEVIPNEEERQILQGGPEVTPDPLVPETTNPAAEGSAPGGVGDLGASTEGPATGSSAPAVSIDQGITPVQEVNEELFGPITHSTDVDFEDIDMSKMKGGPLGPAIYATLEDSPAWSPPGRVMRQIKGKVRGKIIDLTKPVSQEDLNSFSTILGREVKDAVPLVSLEKRFGSISEGLKAAGYSAALHQGPGGTGKQIAVFDPASFVRQPTTVQDLATSNVTAKRNVDPAAFRAMAKENIRPAPESIAPAQRPANPIPAGMAAAHVARAHNLGAGQVDVVNRPEMVARGWLDPKTGRPVINAPWIRNADEVSEVLYHEITHRAEEDPAMRPDIDTFMATLTPAEIDRLNARLARMKYALNEFPTERAAIAISEAANSFRGKSGWAKLVQRVKTWWKELTGQTLNKKDAEAIAARIVTRAVAQLRSGQPMVRGRVSGNVRLSRPEAPPDGFYSKLERVVEGANVGKSQPGSQWASWIKNQGITQDELKWTGVVPWLEAKGKSPVTKAEVLEYLRTDGAVQFEEVVGRDQSVEPTSSTDIFDDNGQKGFAAKYGQYKLPGGENYREVVLTMPGRFNEDQVSVSGSDADGWQARIPNLTNYGFGDTKEAAIAMLRSRVTSGEFKPNAYTSSHFENAPNYIAHYRAQDFGDGMLIEELQSDRHQAGRKYGYKDNDRALQIAKKYFKGINIPPNIEALKAVNASADDLREYAEFSFSHDAIPSAPYRKTWPLQLFKRALKEAVDTGKQWIGWPAGSVVADRFDLSTQVRSISFDRSTDGRRYALYAEPLSGEGEMQMGDHTAEQLPDVVGKDLAEKIISHPEKSGTFEGLDLKVGGEGMQGFYDNILPKEIGNYVKQWGAKVEKTALVTGEKSEAVDNTPDSDPRKQYRMVDVETPIWRVDIPPAMAESISEQGQTKFSRPEPDAPLPLTGPVEGDTRPMAQVMGREGTSPVVPSSQARVLPVIRQNFFDSTAGVSDDNTRKAMDIITTMMGRVTGPELAQRVRGSVDPVDQNIAMGVLRQEVDAYGLAMFATGDKTVFELMQRYATTDWFIGTREDGTAYTYRDVAQELAGNSRLPGSPAAVARDTVNISMHEANSSVLGEEAYTDIRNTVDNTKLEEGEVAEISNIPVAGGQTLQEKVEELVKKKRKPKKQTPSEDVEKPQPVDGEGDVEGQTPATPEEEETSQEDRVAGRYIDRVDKSQVEVMMPEAIPNPVLRYIREQEMLKGWMPKDAFIKSTAAGLVDLGVSDDLAINTAERVWLRKEAIRTAKAKSSAEQSAAAARSFISGFDASQTETLIPTKKDDPVKLILKAAVNMNRGAVAQDAFVKMVADDLVRVTGIPRPLAVNAADRAWLARGIRLANKARLDAERAQKRADLEAERAGYQETLRLEREANVANRQAEGLLDQLAKSQSDTPSSNKKTVDAVREIYKTALKAPVTDANLSGWLDTKLTEAGVTDVAVRAPLVKAIITERAARKAVQVAQEGRALAEGRRGSLKELERQLAEAPAPLQRSPVWRRRIILDYFMQTGLSKPNAEALARAYENEFAERLQQATQRAVERLVNSQTPWARRNKAAPVKRQDRISKEVKKLLEAVRLGLTNPYNLWDAEMAKKNGWNGFTPEQHAELEAMDSKLNSVTLPANEKAQLLLRINRMIVAAKLPPTLANTILTSYVASALSGLSTINVQFSAHVGGIMRAISTIVADPTMQAFREASKTVWKETKFAWKTGAYRNEVLDTLRGHERPLELMFNDGLKAMKSKDPMTRAKGLVKVVTGSQEYVMRALSSIDQGYITAAEEFSGIIFTKDILRQLGMTRKESNMVIEELLRQKDAFYQRLLALGETPMQAAADATDVFMRFLYETIAERNGPADVVPYGAGGKRVDMTDPETPKVATPFTIDGMTMPELAEDMLRAARLDAEGQTGRVSSAEGIGPMDEGILRLPVSALVEAISKYTGQGGSLGLAMRGIFGFVSIPMRTAAWYAGYSPYGFIRYGIHKFQSERGHNSPYAQSYGTRVQVRQRLREATAGSVAMLVLALLATPTADDDEEKENAFFVTGGGPDDLVLREAWLRRFKPYSIVVKAGGKYHAFNYGRTFEAVGWAATLAGTIDDVHARRKAREARGTELDYLDAAAGNLLGNMVERSSFKGMMKFAEIFSRAKEGGTDLRLASQMAFMTSSLVPWKSAMNSVQRLYADPVDNDTIAGSILAATPVAGPIIGRTRINVLGDPAGDVSPGGRAFTLGYPSFGAPQGGKAYDLILQHGRGPSVYHRNQFSKTFQTDDTDALFYDFTYRRGRKIKTALTDNYDRLKDVDSETFAAFLERLSRSVNEQVAAEMKLQRTAKK